MSETKRFLDRALGACLALLVGAAVLNVVWQVFSRFVLRSPSSFTDELARHLLVWTGLIGAAYAAGRRLHVAVDLLPPGLSRRAQTALGVIVEIAVLAFAGGVMIVGGLRLVALSFELGQHSAALGVPLGAVYLALPLSGAAIAAYAVAALVDLVRSGALRREDAT